jgi:hypothetical protein
MFSAGFFVSSTEQAEIVGPNSVQKLALPDSLRHSVLIRLQQKWLSEDLSEGKARPDRKINYLTAIFGLIV